MRIIKFGTLLLLLILALYALSMSFVKDSKSFTVEKEINYPVSKIFPQFNNLQNFAQWNEFFSANKNLRLSFYTPYEGMGSSMTYMDKKNSGTFGDVFIRYANPNKTLRYQLFEGGNQNPYLIDVKFKPLSTSKTLVSWYVHTPKQPLMRRSLNLLTHDFFAENIDQSMKNLFSMLGNKVDKENQIAKLKFDSVMVENQPGQILLGVNVTTSSAKDNLFKNIIVNHNKVVNYVKLDLGKKQDEYGVPMLITDPSNFKGKELSYFYGIPLSKRIGISDNNFSFRTIIPSKNYIIYFKGDYSARQKSIQQLLLQAKKDTMRNGELQEIFLEEPSENKSPLIKFSLPIYR